MTDFKNHPENDQNNWFIAPDIKGPAVVTAIAGGARWEIKDVDGHVFQVNGPGYGIHKLFLKKGQSMSLAYDARDGKVGVISGYKIPE